MSEPHCYTRKFLITNENTLNHPMCSRSPCCGAHRQILVSFVPSETLGVEGLSLNQPQLSGLRRHLLILRVADYRPPLEEQACLGEVRGMGTFVERRRVLAASAWVCPPSLHVDLCLCEIAAVTYQGLWKSEAEPVSCLTENVRKRS